MRILVDACIAGSVVHALRNKGFDVEWVVEWRGDPGDRAILEHARTTARILITRDKDFGELIFRAGLPHCGVLRFAGEMTYLEQANIVLRTMAEHAVELERGCMVTAEHGRTRVSTRSRKH